MPYTVNLALSGNPGTISTDIDNPFLTGHYIELAGVQAVVPSSVNGLHQITRIDRRHFSIPLAITSDGYDGTATLKAIPILSTVGSVKTAIRTTVAHLLQTGMYIEFSGITGGQPVLNGTTHKITVVNSTVFTIDVPSTVDGSGGLATKITVALGGTGGSASASVFDPGSFSPANAVGDFFGDRGSYDVRLPQIATAEWGVDTLTRLVTCADHDLAALTTRLQQGIRFSYAGALWYLSAWDTDARYGLPLLNLTYKGLLNGEPTPLVSYSSRVGAAEASGTITYSNSTTEIHWSVGLHYVSPSVTTKSISSTGVGASQLPTGSPVIVYYSYRNYPGGSVLNYFFEINMPEQQIDPIPGTPFSIVANTNTTVLIPYSTA